MRRAMLGTVLVFTLAAAVAVIRPLEAQVPSAGGALIPNNIWRTAGLWLNNKLLWSSVVPRVASGFGTGASITSNNGNASFRVNVGTGTVSSAGVVSFPTNPPAATGWNCQANTTSAPAGGAFVTKQTATTNTTATFTGYQDDGAVIAWLPNVTLIVTCAAY